MLVTDLDGHLDMGYLAADQVSQPMRGE